MVGAASLSVLLVSKSGLGLHEIKSFLYGELILTTKTDFVAMCAALVPALIGLIVFLWPMLYSFLDREAATVLGVKPARWELLFFIVLGVVVAAASKVAGALLIFCYLLAPAMAALLLSRRLSLVLLLACLLGITETLIGLVVSFAADLPTNQTICMVACVFLLLALPAAGLAGIWPAIRMDAAMRADAGQEILAGEHRNQPAQGAATGKQSDSCSEGTSAGD